MNTAMSHHTHDVNYPDDYMTTTRIFQMDKNDNYVYCTQLYNVFAKTISDIELSTDASDQIETVNITLGYSESQVIGYTVGKKTPEVPATEVAARKPIYPGSRSAIMAQMKEQYFGNPVLDRQTEEAAQQIMEMFGLNR